MNIHWLRVRDYFIKFHYILLIFKIDANNNKINFIQQYTALASCFIMEKQKKPPQNLTIIMTSSSYILVWVGLHASFVHSVLDINEKW